MKNARIDYDLGEGYTGTAVLSLHAGRVVALEEIEVHHSSMFNVAMVTLSPSLEIIRVFSESKVIGKEHLVKIKEAAEKIRSSVQEHLGK